MRDTHPSTCSRHAAIAGSLMIFLTVLAGCSGDPEPAAAASKADSIEPTDATGSIAGVATTDEGLPLTGAVATLVESAEERTTDDEGGFRFDQLEPGAYTVVVRRIGYQD